jgi:hypothetical protein
MANRKSWTLMTASDAFSTLKNRTASMLTGTLSLVMTC